MKSSISILEDYQNDPNTFAWGQINEARKFKSAGFPVEFTINQVELDRAKIDLQTRAYYHPQLKELTDTLEKTQREVDDIKSRYDHFVNAEKVTVPSRTLVIADFLAALLDRLRGKAKEAKKFISNSSKN